ncbi:MAG: hypothetical protein Q4G50_09615 [Corynebacterium sp.]|nr:hypothetical protein [Corynebacterium sp.]MDO5670249.1 hypothetical protein [Corynebacterium sp.]
MTSPLEQAILAAVGGTDPEPAPTPQEVSDVNSHEELIEKLLG